MIRRGRGNLLLAQVDALVNTVNTVGVMGKGVALQFRRAWPANYEAYRAACTRGGLHTGRIWPWATGEGWPQWIINFPTKQHWRNPSRIEWIEEGLLDLRAFITARRVQSIAVPPLGCGNGGLDWSDVRPVIERTLDLPATDVWLYDPRDAPLTGPVATPTPDLTPATALLLVAMDYYRGPLYRLGRLEVQKLAYLLQAAGAPGFAFRFVPHKYGPYSEAVTQAVAELEGHQISGFGDRSGPSSIQIGGHALRDARGLARGDPAARAAVRVVHEAITGYETPYGLELLSTVHWTATHAVGDAPAEPPEARVWAWSPRKQRLMARDHIHAARQRLSDVGLLP